MTQCERILAYMKENGSITQLEALREFGCMRLASRISEMRQRGIKIKSKTEHTQNRYGENINYSRYYMEIENGYRNDK